MASSVGLFPPLERPLSLAAALASLPRSRDISEALPHRHLSLGACHLVEKRNTAMTRTASDSPPDDQAKSAAEHDPAAEKALSRMVFWLASGAFAIGCTEFAAMSLLPYYARGFGISEPMAGHAVSAYAFGVVIGAPVIATLCGRMSRKTLLIALMIAFALGNLLAACAPSAWMLIASRFLSGLPHGAYLGIAMLFAAEVAGKGRRARMVSYVILGLTIANIIGVPAVNALGQAAGWRMAFVAIAALAFLTVVMVWRTAPADGRHPEASPLAELRAFRNRDVLLALAMGAIGFGGMFAVYAFFSATLIQETDSPEWLVSAVLILFGIGATLGNWVAGRVSGGHLLAAAGAYQAVLGAAALFYAFSVGHWPSMALAILLIGMGGGMAVPLQTRLMDVAGEAQTLAAAMNHAAFNFANALGPLLAGAALAAGWGPRAPGFVGLGLALCGLAIWAVMMWLERKPKR